ncbi:mercuric transporter MerT family protein [Aurantimonas sp. C2-6-R+9]|uniref:mercuric transporter MerT family protein n=1 Tax=unclassified Aurantimonas TaxID=2638230 RepID=UPI002E17E43F|nr:MULTISPECIES: mercuric transporter MerT family protein [unclassified Aurantimonas]MEC5290490.1 mercuric transporter MerT family protein [Aurantimonas sp. C2-3-R2]MEC5380501.1 mercuric transporter MerT family protein [Aurantimonas sp. C2-6-R+9]MEC5411547.1 mercuric transporter MerT family protein [Aurantimonas sp. C2-4-R8]
MSDTAAEIGRKDAMPAAPERREGWFAGGGVVGAVLASSCCIAPLVLVTLGISGAWIGNLTVLTPYQPYFVALTLVFLGLGFWQVYFRPKAACAVGAACARPIASLITQSALWIATVLVILSMTNAWWAPLFY